MTKVIVITGLTASGKSGLAIKLAKKYNGEIISADSVQIYRGLNIGSAKEDDKILNEITHHLINIKDFNESYNVGEFIIDTKKAMDKIILKGKLPIIVGGTGMYIKALLEGYSLGETSANEELRKNYQIKAQNKGNLAVWNDLKTINSSLAEKVHPNNLKRVIRYLEISQNECKLSHTDSILKGFDVLSVGIVANRDIIYDKINRRVDDMIASGLQNEVYELIKSGATRQMQAFNSIGYKEWFDFFENKTSRQKTIDLIKQHTRNYCKRQLTFLKTINNLQLLTLAEAEELINKHMEK